MALLNGYSDLERRHLRPPSSNSTSTTRKTASGNSCKNLRAIQRSDQKLWPFRTGTRVSSDKTSDSPSSDSTCTPRKTASGNSCRTGTLVSSDYNSDSSISNSTSTARKTTSGNSCKNLRAIQRSNQQLWPFRTGTLV